MKDFENREQVMEYLKELHKNYKSVDPITSTEEARKLPEGGMFEQVKVGKEIIPVMIGVPSFVSDKTILAFIDTDGLSKRIYHTYHGPVKSVHY